MDWLLPYYWSAALGAPIASMTWWGWHGPAVSEPAADDVCVEAAALEIELIGVVCEVLL
jgi:hypothetical protein